MIDKVFDEHGNADRKRGRDHEGNCDLELHACVSPATMCVVAIGACGTRIVEDRLA
jgi:hypothetical protein